MSQDANPFRSRLGLLVPINNLQPRQQEQLLADSEILEVRRRDFVFRQGDRDAYAYYLLAGELEMIAGDQLIKKVIGGEAASFQPLAQLQPRQMSARAVTHVQVLRVERRLLDQLLSAAQDPGPTAPAIEVTELSAHGSVDWLTMLLQCELFSRIPAANAQRLLEALEPVVFEQGAVIIEQGSPGDYYYVVQEGRCEVCRATSRGREVRLAELGPGDTFGEEALVSNSKRNATVRMLDAGTLGRLTKEQFIELIGTPVLQAVSLAEARAVVAAGGRWLDVRFPEECQVNGLSECINLPLNLLRTRCDELDRTVHYVAYCDTGGRSSAAAFLLAQEGFEVCYVEAGAIDELGHLRPAAPDPAPAPVPVPVPVSNDEPAAVPTDQALSDEVERARGQIEEARRMLAAAADARRDAERYVATRLADERARLQQDAKTLKAHVAEATRIKTLLEAREREAIAAAASERSALEQRVEAYRAATERALREKETRLERLYQQQATQLEQIEIDRANAQRELDSARARIELESTQNHERLLAAQRLEAEIERREREAEAAFAAREAALRAALRAEMDAERQRLEREFARSAAEIAQARREQLAAEAARRAAEADAARIAEEFHLRQARQILEMETALRAEHARLEERARALEAALSEALSARAAAEASRDDALAQLAAARAAEAPAGQAPDWQTRIAAIEARAAAAAQRLRAALEVETDAVRARDENARRLDEARASHRELTAQADRAAD